MRFMISYFYQVRNFEPDMIPISTARWDPDWFHNGMGQNYVFKDKRGIYNGIRYEYLVPNEECCHLCLGKDKCLSNGIVLGQCDFLKKYKEQIDKINFSAFLNECEGLKQRIGIEDPCFVFMVYEAPNNPCSERDKIIEWFEENSKSSLPLFKK